MGLLGVGGFECLGCQHNIPQVRAVFISPVDKAHKIGLESKSCINGLLVAFGRNGSLRK